MPRDACTLSPQGTERSVKQPIAMQESAEGMAGAANAGQKAWTW
jgi:hypothetical protein